MPPASKSPAQPPSARRAGAPKAKGAVRAKSGCYTCRIRRKKCDEQPNEQGYCSTCVRLRLECLGFGAKRPDWLRENRNVLQLRDKIKNFLASQGMIKGHSGSGARSSEQPTVLRLTLTEDNSPYHSGSSSSPPSRSQTLANEDYVHPRHHHQAPGSRTPWAAPSMPEQAYRHTNGHYATHSSDYHRSVSPQSIEYPPQIPSPHSLVQPLQKFQRYYRHHPYQIVYQQRLNVGWTPAKSSALSPSYNWNDTEMANMAFFTQAEALFSSVPSGSDYTESSNGANATIHDNASRVSEGTESTSKLFFSTIPAHVDLLLPFQAVASLLQRYNMEVVNVQYSLGTEFIRNYITTTRSMVITGEESTIEQQAATLLSRVHFLRFSHSHHDLVLRNQTGVYLHVHQIESLLNQSIREPKPEDAMAALHLISMVLCDGGHSDKWRQYLYFAANYVKERMSETREKNGGLEKLGKSGDKEAFIVKTAIWFDVLASVTTNESPLLLDVVRSLFKPSRSGLAELSNTTALMGRIDDDDGNSTPPNEGESEEKTSMMFPMGCENRVVWAFAEISALAHSKWQLKERGKLSIKNLVLQSNNIEKELEARYMPVESTSDYSDVMSYSRYLVSNIFRTSALLYLHAVVNGGYPRVHQISLAVDEVMRWIRCIPWKPKEQTEKQIRRTVIRGAVFAFYITGALTDDEKYRKTIVDHLVQEVGAVMGNCKAILEILNEIWSERRSGRSGFQCTDEVLWREKLTRRLGESILLV